MVTQPNSPDNGRFVRVGLAFRATTKESKTLAALSICGLGDDLNHTGHALRRDVHTLHLVRCPLEF